MARAGARSSLRTHGRWLARALGTAVLVGPWLVGACGGDDARGDGEASSAGTVSDGGTATTGASGGDGGTVDDTGEPPLECAANEVVCGAMCAELDTDPSNCGQCGRSCVVPQAVASCVAGECAMASCEPGYSDCDGDVQSGCETPIDCQEGMLCTTTCGSEGVVDCTDVCAAAGEPVCLAPPEACNVIDDDCDGACDQGPLPGCRVSVHRSNSPTLGHFYTTDLAEAQSGDKNLEAQDYFWIYAQVEGLQPLFRCIKGNGKRWLTTSTDCEGTAAPELAMGFISPDDRCNATPLYRLLNVGPDAHFYTVSAAERDNAVDNLGFQDQGIAGYVWSGP
ncbi:hypothetical protein [Paraliomyxa miuraensis]|uniref:hypothetical protein n=1 Tax=Paraliomyxa miuraensis TaxID=376150 RepID=UPI0022518916|nr:hypothetical protein [Paraliomyxa miuraensis]MCX4240925.1 hypothetical protein [Paraliomyxa miuraensis]